MRNSYIQIVTASGSVLVTRRGHAGSYSTASASHAGTTDRDFLSAPDDLGPTANSEPLVSLRLPTPAELADAGLTDAD
jgi:hypothetical protein